MSSFPPKSRKRKRSEPVECPLPVDMGLKIVSSLKAVDLFSLASSSRFWRDVCGYDCVWEPLFKDRWGANFLNEDRACNLKGWREYYMKEHKKIASEVNLILDDYFHQVSSSGSVEHAHYLAALEGLNTLHLPFKEVEYLFFQPKIQVLLKLVALHYCILYLQVPVDTIREMLVRCKMANNRICIRWSSAKKCKGFFHFVTCSLDDLLIGSHDLNYIGIRRFSSSLKVKISAA